MDERIRRLLMETPYSAADVSNLSRQGFAPPTIPSFNLGVESTQSPMPSNPMFRGGIEAPVMGGILGLSGSYLKPDQYAPPDISALLRYRRQF